MKHYCRDGRILEVCIEQTRIHKNRQDSFWYDGRIAVCNGYELIVCGETRVEFKRNGDHFMDHNAISEALNLKLYDKDLSKAKVNWINNNWFTLSHETEDIDDGGVYGTYDEGIKALLWAAETNFGENE